MTRSRTMRSTGGRSGASSRASARLAGFGGFDLIAETPRHRLEQPALDRIVVDDENQGGHEISDRRGLARPLAGRQSDITVNVMLMSSQFGAIGDASIEGAPLVRR